MIGQYRITANLMEVDERKNALHFGVKIEGKGNPAVLQCFNAEIFEVILKAMKGANKHAFYEAMSEFTKKDFNDAIEFFTGEDDD